MSRNWLTTKRVVFKGPFHSFSFSLLFTWFRSFTPQKQESSDNLTNFVIYTVQGNTDLYFGKYLWTFTCDPVISLPATFFTYAFSSLDNCCDSRGSAFLSRSTSCSSWLDFFCCWKQNHTSQPLHTGAIILNAKCKVEGRLTLLTAKQ